MWATSVKNWANDVKNWPTEQGGGPNPGHSLSWIRASLGMLRFTQAAQVCTATGSGSLSHRSVLNLVCSGSKAEVELSEVRFTVRVRWYQSEGLYPLQALVCALPSLGDHQQGSEANDHTYFSYILGNVSCSQSARP
jgi:hypothetical protein